MSEGEIETPWYNGPHYLCGVCHYRFQYFPDEYLYFCQNCTCPKCGTSNSLRIVAGIEQL